jgi:hypothetical protein
MRAPARYPSRARSGRDTRAPCRSGGSKALLRQTGSAFAPLRTTTRHVLRATSTREHACRRGRCPEGGPDDCFSRVAITRNVSMSSSRCATLCIYAPRRDRHPSGLLLSAALLELRLLSGMSGGRRDAFSVTSAELAARRRQREAWQKLGWPMRPMAPSAALLDGFARLCELVQRGFGRRAVIGGGQQERQAGVCPQRRGLEDEVEVADERVVEPVPA